VTQAEYWLLDLVVRLPHPIRILTAENLCEAVNKPTSHGLDRASLLEILLELFGQGDLVATRDAGSFVPLRAEIEYALLQREDRRHRIYFELTPRGGARWESVSKPRWTSFVDVELGHGSGSNDGFVTASSRELVESYLELYRHPASGDQLVVGNERWTTVAPWHATYWKDLSSGCRADFEWMPRTATTQTSDVWKDYSALLSKFTRWYEPWSPPA
jgi:hypothetical protein